MNIFYLDPNPEQCAKWHCDKHVVKMITEYTQLLCAVKRLYDGESRYFIHPKKGLIKSPFVLPEERPKPVCFLMSHENHPCTKWAAMSEQNFNYLLQLTEHLVVRYKKLYGNKYHASEKSLEYTQTHLPSLKSCGFTEPPMVMPSYCYELTDLETIIEASKAYKIYYIIHKYSFAKWKDLSKPPRWFELGKKLLDGVLDRDPEEQMEYSYRIFTTMYHKILK